MSAKMRFDDCRNCVNDVNLSRGIPRSGSGIVDPRNFRFSCLALRAADAFEDEDFARGVLTLGVTLGSASARSLVLKVSSTCLVGVYRRHGCDRLCRSCWESWMPFHRGYFEF
jgi:hypothetical protein